MRKFLLSVVCIAVALFAIGTGTAFADADYSVSLIGTNVNYQGENNFYFLTGNFEENNLYRAYYTQQYGGKWQGSGGYTNWISASPTKELYPIGGGDAIIAYVFKDTASVTLFGRVVEAINTGADIDASIVHRHSDASADTVIFESNIINSGADTQIPSVTFRAKAGDTLYFVASEGTTATSAWDSIVYDVIMQMTVLGGKANASSLSAVALPMMGYHTITVTDGVVDAHVINESMKVDNVNGNVFAIWQALDGSFNRLLTSDGGGTYTLDGTHGFGNCSTGINVNRVFYSNAGWTGHAGMQFVAPADGTLNILGKAVINAPVEAKIYKVSAGGTESVASISAGEVNFADVEAVNGISVKTGEQINIVFVGNDAWQSASAAMIFDFCKAPVLNGSNVTIDTNNFRGVWTENPDKEALAAQGVNVEEDACVIAFCQLTLNGLDESYIAEYGVEVEFGGNYYKFVANTKASDGKYGVALYGLSAGEFNFRAYTLIGGEYIYSDAVMTCTQE